MMVRPHYRWLAVVGLLGHTGLLPGLYHSQTVFRALDAVLNTISGGEEFLPFDGGTPPKTTG